LGFRAGAAREPLLMQLGLTQTQTPCHYLCRETGASSRRITVSLVELENCSANIFVGLEMCKDLIWTPF